jgi:hypothetical protein
MGQRSRQALRVGAPAQKSAMRALAIAIRFMAARRRSGLVRDVANVMGDERAPAGKRADAALEGQASRLPGVVADARREGFQVRRFVNAPVQRQGQVTRQSHDLQRRHGHGTVCAMEREASFGEADAGTGEHHPFAQEHRMNAKQLAWRGPEKNGCRRTRVRVGRQISADRCVWAGASVGAEQVRVMAKAIQG